MGAGLPAGPHSWRTSSPDRGRRYEGASARAETRPDRRKHAFGSLIGEISGARPRGVESTSAILGLVTRYSAEQLTQCLGRGAPSAMTAEPLSRVLEATGYLENGEPAAASVRIGAMNQLQQYPSFDPEASWRSPAPSPQPNGSCSRELTVYFKYVREPVEPTVAQWQRELWNRGFTPLLWVVSDQRVELYNGFSRPRSQDTAADHLVETFRTNDSDLAKLALRAGRMSMETGQFWQQIPSLNRKTAVDRQLLRELRELERVLLAAKLKLPEVHKLIIRSIFVKYLFDRNILGPTTLMEICGHSEFFDVFNDRIAATRLFDWLQDTFNGDMFPSSDASFPDATQLDQVGRFFRGENLLTRQQSLFPYQFDVIPVEFISAIYEQFVHSAIHETQENRKKSDIHYSPLPVVSLILDEVMNELTGSETVLDLTCGSGVFLVESLRRLVYLKARNRPLSRELILDTLYNQVYGIDKCETAIRISAFSLYLTALELDPTSQTAGCPKFRPIIGTTLFDCNAFSVQNNPKGQPLIDSNGSLKQFDVVVGNPPWSYLGSDQADHLTVLSAADIDQPRVPRGVSFDFLQRAIQFSHRNTRFGIVVSAMHFFAISSTARLAVRNSLKKLLPVTLVNLSELSSWLFPNANMPAMVVLGRHNRSAGDDMTLVQARWSFRNWSSRMIEIAPSDVSAISFAAWEKRPVLLKAGFFGQDRDISLLFDLCEHYGSLEKELTTFNTRFRTGFIAGSRNLKDAQFLEGLPYAGRTTLNSGFSFSGSLPACDVTRAPRPRDQNTFQGPLLLIRQFLMDRPRPRVAIHDGVLAFDDAYYGVSFSGRMSRDIYEIIAGILRSQLTSWYLLMAGAIFGLAARQIKLGDLTSLPVPDLELGSRSEAGQRIRRFVNDYRFKDPSGSEWDELDSAVFDLYQFDATQRIAVQDGYARSLWQWKEGRLNSMEPVGIDDLRRYADTFLGTMDAWAGFSGCRRLSAEIYQCPNYTPIQVIRFFVDDHTRQQESRVVIRPGSLQMVLAGIADRTGELVAPEFVGLRELRVHSSDEVNIVKSTARRNWLAVQALSDADLVVQDFVADRWSNR